MKTKLFYMFELAIAMLTSCGAGNKESNSAAATGNDGKGAAAYQFSDGTVITKDKKGNYKSNIGTVDKVEGDIIVVHIPNVGHDNDVDLQRALYFSTVYNINLQDPIVTAEDYCVVVDLYPQSGLIAACKSARAGAEIRYKIKTFDGYSFIFPVVGDGYKTEYRDFAPGGTKIDGNTGQITIPYHEKTPFTRKDIDPSWIKEKQMFVNFRWWFNPTNTYEVIPSHNK